MKRLRNLIVRFIARAVVEDYRANGITRQVLLDERGDAEDVGLLFRIPATKKQ